MASFVPPSFGFKDEGVGLKVGCSCLDHFGLEGLMFHVFSSCRPVSVSGIKV